ncbi:GNAT family N-acetyltransferase [Anaerocolumna xylanovorans]|uniref:L-amino acid N-acyltransferase YncA n=1 Tax=Anaerocolumna xylanovorans DSM 12503 TaxID=1121345 RepID=A0A1M7XX62_9FIRM|nr:GNAT family N-acetyltransferase [Anaerocolumna xylanovorans]SHO43453.1 L-amino acid N-acyltransferase YncA [Anaerocolumna xylanovorans DSM 12503]
MKKDDWFQIREAKEEDTKDILDLIIELAAYEKMENLVTATEEILKDSLFHRGVAKALIAEYDGKPVGYAIYFFNFSTFTGKAGIYLEDIYMKPAFRGKGYGKALLGEVAREAVKRGCPRLEWACLNWNKPSINFYESLEAKHLDEWRTYRITGENIRKLAGEE